MPAVLLRFLPHIFLMLGLVSIITMAYFKIRADVKNEIEVKDLKVTVKDQEELNEIRNNRPTNDDLFDSLYNGTF